jgi:HKD family nuclease
VKFYSTGKISGKKSASGASVYNFAEHSDLTTDVNSAKAIYIVSAFYNFDFFTALCSAAKKSTRIEVILPRERGIHRQKNQRAFCQRLVALHKRVTILLVDSPYLLHTKLFIFDFGDGFAAWLGSSNASSNSLDMCEELMVRTVSSASPTLFSKYYQAIKGESIKYDEFSEPPATKGIYDFFNQGSLYVKTSETFNPAIELDFGKHKEAVLGMLSSQSDDIAGLFVNASTRLSLFGLLQRIVDFKDVFSKLNEHKQHPEGIKKYGVATCLGLWVPDGYQAEVERILYESQAARQKQAKLDLIHQMLSNSKLNDYSDVISALHIILEGIAARIDVPLDTFYRTSGKKIHTNINRLIRKIEYCLERLAPDTNSRLRSLLINPYYRTSMPTIWDDDLVREDFLLSFNESLSAESERKRIENNLYHSFLHYCGESKLISSLAGQPEVMLRQILRNDFGRWFSQNDFRLFRVLNERAEGFTVIPLSDSDASGRKHGSAIFYEEGEFLIPGRILSSHRGQLACSFEDEDTYSYAVTDEHLFVMK